MDQDGMDELEGWDLDGLLDDDEKPLASEAPVASAASAEASPAPETAKAPEPAGADELDGWDLDGLLDDDEPVQKPVQGEAPRAAAPPAGIPVPPTRPEAATPSAPEPPTNAEPMGEKADRQRSLEDLRLDAQLRIGTASIALKSILSIKVGEVIPLDRPLTAPVHVMAGGRVVATGELVNVNGFYAVKIKEVSSLERHLPADAAQMVH